MPVCTLTVFILCVMKELSFSQFSLFKYISTRKSWYHVLLCLEILILLSTQLIHNNVSWMLEFCRMAVENCLESLALCAVFQLRASQRKPLLKPIVFIVFLVLFFLCSLLFYVSYVFYTK